MRIVSVKLIYMKSEVRFSNKGLKKFADKLGIKIADSGGGYL